MVQFQKASRARGRGRAAPILLTAIILAGSAGGAAAEDKLLARLAGDWIGRGSAKVSADAVPEQLYCKFSNKLGADGISLTQSGRCAYGNRSGGFSGTLAGAGGAYSGTWQTPLTQGASSVSGSGGGGRLTLTTRGVAKETGEPVQAQITIDVNQGGYRMVTRGTDPQSGARFEVSDIVFTKAN